MARSNLAAVDTGATNAADAPTPTPRKRGRSGPRGPMKRVMQFQIFDSNGQDVTAGGFKLKVLGFTADTDALLSKVMSGEAVHGYTTVLIPSSVVKEEVAATAEPASGDTTQE